MTPLQALPSWNAMSEPDPLHLVLGEPFLGSVIQLGRPRAFVRRHFLGMLERSAIGKVGGDPRGAEGVAADLRGDAGRFGAPADHAPGIRLAHRLIG
jgi:hypothetical protein